MAQDNYTLVEKYLSNQLSEEERKAFREQLQTDNALREEYDLQKSMNIFLEKDRNQAALQNQFNQLGKEFFQEKKEEAKVVPMNRNRNRFLIGILSAAAVGLLLFFFNPLQSGSMYDQTKAEAAFNEKNYSSAYELLTTYLQNNPGESKAQLALGISALETGKTSRAVDIFTQLKNGNSALKDYGTWYLGLTYLKEKDMEKAKSFFEQVPQSQKKLYEDAQEILGKMK